MAEPSIKVKLVVGGIGGLAPILAKLLILDADAIASYLQNFDIEFIKFIGYVLWSCILFGAGLFWAFIHKAENNLLKIFQLGIVAPAMITGVVQSAQMKAIKGELYNATKEITAIGNNVNEGANYDKSKTNLVSLISKAYAADAKSDKRHETEINHRPIWNQLIAGALARPIENKVEALVKQFTNQRKLLNTQKATLTNLKNSMGKLLDECESERERLEDLVMRCLQRKSSTGEKSF